MRRLLLGLALGTAVPAMAQDMSGGQASLDRMAASMGYRVTIVDNRPPTCPGGGGCFLSDIELVIPADLPAVPAGAEIRYGFVSRVIAVESDLFDNRLINGDLNALVLKPGKTLQPGTRHRVRVIGAGHFFSRLYVMPNAYLVAPGLTPRVIAATCTGTDADTGMETVPLRSHR